MSFFSDSFNFGPFKIGGPPFLTGFSNRLKFKTDPSVVSGNLTNYPMLIRIDGSAGKGSKDITAVFDEVGANSHKIAVTTSDGQTQLYAEIGRWDNTGEVATLWVLVPTLRSDGSTFYLYYDSTVADNDTYILDTGSAGAQTMWSNTDYLYVSHMNRSMVAGDEMIDNINLLVATNHGTLAETTDAYKEAPTGYAAEWSGGGDDRLYMANNSSVALSFANDLTTEITIEWMIYPHGQGEGGFGRVWEMNEELGSYIQSNATPLFKVAVLGDHASGNVQGDGSGITFNAWNYGYFGWGKSLDSGVFDIIVNGTANTPSSNPDTTSTIGVSADRIDIGNFYNGGAWNRTFDGLIAELRVANKKLGNDWAAANNATWKDNFVTW